MWDMDPDAYRLQTLTLQAFDLSERTVRRSRASAVRRVERLRSQPGEQAVRVLRP